MSKSKDKDKKTKGKPQKPKGGKAPQSDAVAGQSQTNQASAGQRPKQNSRAGETLAFKTLLKLSELPLAEKISFWKAMDAQRSVFVSGIPQRSRDQFAIQSHSSQAAGSAEQATTNQNTSTTQKQGTGGRRDRSKSVTQKNSGTSDGKDKTSGDKPEEKFDPKNALQVQKQILVEQLQNHFSSLLVTSLRASKVKDINLLPKKKETQKDLNHSWWKPFRKDLDSLQQDLFKLAKDAVKTDEGEDARKRAYNKFLSQEVRTRAMKFAVANFAALNKALEQSFKDNQVPTIYTSNRCTFPVQDTGGVKAEFDPKTLGDSPRQLLVPDDQVAEQPLTLDNHLTPEERRLYNQCGALSSILGNGVAICFCDLECDKIEGFDGHTELWKQTYLKVMQIRDQQRRLARQRRQGRQARE